LFRLFCLANGLTVIRYYLASLTMDYFLSCDWGTTFLRVRLVDIKQKKVLLEEASFDGILNTFNSWQQTGKPDGQPRTDFYLAKIAGCIKELEPRIGSPLGGVKIIISGMASSSAGFVTVSYAGVPLSTDGSGLKTAIIKANDQFRHDCLVISGVKTNDDIMRGEETQLIGCTDRVKNGLFIFPGTHSKHIRVRDDQITGFKTYMTGEFFELLSRSSILKNSVKASTPDDSNLQVFKKGVQDAVRENLLHSAFTVRVNDLFDIFTRQQNFAYLSGLVIGTELKDMLAEHAETVNLISAPHLSPWYCAALDELGIKYAFSANAADKATVQGHVKIGRLFKFIP